jgi:hypothetical protein
MTNASTNAVLQAAAKTLAWELYAAAGYGRTRTRIDVDKFDRELRSAARTWRATHNNLNKKRRKRHGTKTV